MRVLFTFVGGRGHFEPLAPIARAAQEMGHSVAFGCAPPMVSAVEAAGFAVFPIGADASNAPKRLPLRPLDRLKEDRDLRDRFARRAARYRAPSVIGALAHGLPSVLIPLGADQPLNADRCTALRVAAVLDAVTATPEDIRAAVATVLDDSAYRRNAERLRDEIAALPEAPHAIELLERLAVEKRPLYPD